MKLWGKVECYKYFYTENQSITFNTSGKEIKLTTETPQAPATLTFNGKNVLGPIQINRA